MERTLILQTENDVDFYGCTQCSWRMPKSEESQVIQKDFVKHICSRYPLKSREQPA